MYHHGCEVEGVVGLFSFLLGAALTKHNEPRVELFDFSVLLLLFCARRRHSNVASDRRDAGVG